MLYEDEGSTTLIGDKFEVYTESNDGYIRYTFNDFIKVELVIREMVNK